MDKLTITIKYEGKTYKDVVFPNDSFIVSRGNPDFISLIEQKCKESGFEKRDVVKARLDMEL
jgi:hypothetical protein